MVINKIIAKSIACFILVLLVSCDDQIIQGVADESVTGQGDLESCLSASPFSGIESITNVKDSSVVLNWQEEASSLGYSIFQETSAGGLEFIETIAAGNTTYKVTGLSPLSDYSYIVKSIDDKGLNDCNNVITAVTTLNKETFKSCLDIQTFYGNTEPSGTYEIDVDLDGPKVPFNVYCDMDHNGGGWTRIFVHKTVGGIFASKEDAKEKNTNDIEADLYSQLIQIEDFKREGKFEFWLNYDSLDGNDGGNRWTQTSNPVTEEIAGYTAIIADHTDNRWGGLEPDKGSNTLLNGTVGSNNWFYAIGAIRYWPNSGTIPGPRVAVDEVVLYIR